MISLAQLLPIAVPMLLGSHVAAYMFGKSAGIRWCKNLRDVLLPHTDERTGETIWKPKATPLHGAEQKR